MKNLCLAITALIALAFESSALAQTADRASSGNLCDEPRPAGCPQICETYDAESKIVSVTGRRVRIQLSFEVAPDSDFENHYLSYQLFSTLSDRLAYDISSRRLRKEVPFAVTQSDSNTYDLDLDVTKLDPEFRRLVDHWIESGSGGLHLWLIAREKSSHKVCGHKVMNLYYTRSN